MQVLLRRLWIQVTSDRKRFSILCVMVALGMLLWARIIVTSNVPRTAVADPGAGSGQAGAGSAATGRQRPPVPLKLDRLPARDPLSISDRHFPRPTGVDLVGKEGKAGTEAVENVEEAEARLTEELRALANRFSLEGVMQGQPMAIINGRAYELYAWIPAMGGAPHLFQLAEVGNRSVVLECEGRRFRVKMDDPGSKPR